MPLHTIDLGIIVVYLLATVFIGLFFVKKASRSLDSYFLADRGLPWYILGLSNASSMFDINGILWLVYLLFVYGLKSIWLPWLLPLFSQIFFMVYLSIWLRRSNVMTGAEWMTTRFGRGRGAALAHVSTVIFALVSVIGLISCAFQVIGLLSTHLFPWDLGGIVPGVTSARLYAILFVGITTIYVLLGGLFGVVYTAVLQFIIMAIASIAVGVIAMSTLSPGILDSIVPAGWKNLFFSWQLHLDWSGILNAANLKIDRDGYSLFALTFLLILFRGVLLSMAGPAPNFDMQRILAARSPKEASLMSGFVNVMLIPRHMLTAGLVVLGLVFYLPKLRAMGSIVDLRMIVPYTVRNFIPAGLLGLVLAAFLSAFMSTFAATVHAASAYIVNDIYKRYINPVAETKSLILASRMASLAMVVAGVGLGLISESISGEMLRLTLALLSGFAMANILKWHWWRFTGCGYFCGMLAGILAALLAPIALPNLSAAHHFLVILAIAFLFCLLGTVFSTAETDEVLMRFYQRVRPWGFWGPINKKVRALYPELPRDADFGRHWRTILIGMVWQASLSVAPIFLVIKWWPALLIAVVAIALSSLLLKISWLDKLADE
ncbi:Na+:solute symporter [candidate division KSB1 bacterium]|nr:Na+:solute symporter [candidate division KSB1 bacterium]RQW01411.1 MAG: sodium:solute symporter [candidate division KSB1 bacterium]